MKRLLLLLVFLASLIAVYGQVSKVKNVHRIPVDSAAVQLSALAAETPVIDGSLNVQTRSGDASDNPYPAVAAQDMQLPDRFDMDSMAIAAPKQAEPQSVFIERERSQLRSGIVRSHAETTYAFFRETPKLHIPTPEAQIRIDTIMTDDLDITHIKGSQLFHNVPVYGMDFTFHISATSERFMGYTVDSTQIDTLAARLSAADAIRIAENDLSGTTTIHEPSVMMRELLNYTQPLVSAIYYPDATNTYRYCYKVIIRPNFRDEWIYYIDGNSGEVVEKYNNTPTEANTGTGKDLNNVSRTVNTWLANGVHYMINTTKPMPFNQSDWSGVIGVYDTKGNKNFHEGVSIPPATNSSASWDNPAAISAMYHASLVYDELKKNFNRNSFDNKGASMKMFINVCDTLGNGYDNSYWNGAQVALGNGKTYFKNFAGALDVVAHEFGHAVVQYTAKLEYKNQSGAINEAYADIFGVMADRNYTIGESVANKTYYPTGFMRDMSNPHNGGQKYGDRGWQPAHVSEMYLGDWDYGGVHVNNSIPTHTFYVYAKATSIDRALQVYYHALDKYLTPTSNFKDLRIAILQAAKDKNFSGDVKTLENAFDKVGVVDETVNNKPPETKQPADLQTNPGQSELLVLNMDSLSSSYIDKITDSYKTRTSITKTALISTPSITDNGKKAVFVDGTGNVRQYDMATGSETRQVFGGLVAVYLANHFQSVAISRDGNRLAAISNYEDGSIFIYNFARLEWRQFKLYNPTTGTDGAKTYNVLYADAIEFDHTGEHLIYDAVNKGTRTIGGEEEYYFDIGIIKVWDNGKNTWGSGEIVKLYPNLGQGVHVLNPVYSKNSPHIIAYEYYDEAVGRYLTYGANLATGETKSLFYATYSSLSPSFSMDDKHIAYHYRNTTTNTYNVSYFPLGSNKISLASSTSTSICTKCAYPVYYGTGTRTLGAKPTADFSVDARSGGRQLKVQFVDTSLGNPNSWRWTFQGGTPASSTVQHPSVTYNTTGTFNVSLTATNPYGSNELVKQGYITINATGAEFIETPAVVVYPNPASDYVWITGDGVQSVRLFDVIGKAVSATLVNDGGRARMDVSGLRAGIYFLQISLSNGTMQTQKLIKH